MTAMQTSMQTADLEISGVDATPASRGVCSALECIHGVTLVRMDPNKRDVTVTYDAFKVAPRQFLTAVRVMGCEVERLSVRTTDVPVANNVTDPAVTGGPIHRSESRPE